MAFLGGAIRLEEGIGRTKGIAVYLRHLREDSFGSGGLSRLILVAAWRVVGEEGGEGDLASQRPLELPSEACTDRRASRGFGESFAMRRRLRLALTIISGDSASPDVLIVG